MKKNVLFATLLCFPLIFTACGGDTVADTPVEESQEKAAEEVEEIISAGDLGDYTFSINNYVLAEDYEGNPAIIVDFDFTNNGKDATSFMVAGLAKAFQDGIELENAIIMNADVYNADNYMKEIKTGATLNVQQAWTLTSTESPVEVELEEFVSFSDDKLAKTFEIAE